MLPPTIFQNGKVVDMYLIGEMGPPENYTEWLDVLNTAVEDSEINIYINSTGGDIFTALQLKTSMEMSEAKVRCHLMGVCFSSASIVFMSGDEQIIAEHGLMMIHQHTSIATGKALEQLLQIQAERRWVEQLYMRTFKDFLSKEEIADVLSGKDIWLSSSDIFKRLFP
jgi:ATP-dependent protease ClpP protease subunit